MVCHFPFLHICSDRGGASGLTRTTAGDRFPSARVRGIDLTPIQPLWLPPNVDFLVDDCEKDWINRDCDLVHLRFMVVILKDVPKVLGNAYT
jgi:hypothetical protein